MIPRAKHTIPASEVLPADTTAIILTGGKSSRMGRPKALLPFGNEPLIIHIVRALNRMFAETVVVAAPEQELPALPATLVRDEVPYQGPVGGIYYGLKTASGKFGFVTSCDLAFINAPLISHLIAQISNHDVVVPDWQGRLQPLCAVYRRSVLSLLKEQLDRSELRLGFLFERVRMRRVSEEEIRRFDPDGLSFLNMNTPEDYAAALKRWEELNRHRDQPQISSSLR
jgi:molybdopterin-guanine dinucleotide biosynthesis protein A